MKIVKRPNADIKIEQAHGGSGARKVFADSSHTKGKNFEAMTHGFLPAGSNFDWHDHKDIEEIMVVLMGEGKVEDKDGTYSYSPGDVFIFPPNVEHKIVNPTNEEHEMIFVRVKL
jgi:quercetin dioxygenase-like cupin family protein